jgi:hypothetical protein
MSLDTPPVAIAEMLIRRPASDLYRAFVDPAITSKFWYSSGSGMLEVGKSVTWHWAWYGATADVLVRSLEPDRSRAVPSSCRHSPPFELLHKGAVMLAWYLVRLYVFLSGNVQLLAARPRRVPLDRG